MANNKISKYFKRLDTNQVLTSDADFLSLPLNTKIARDTGEEYIKRYGNVFDKTQKSFITSESADGVFAKLKEDNTFTANNTFEKGVKLGQEPTLLEHATTKKYVDGKIKEANDEITNIINGTNQTDSNIAYINKNNKFQGTQNFTNVAIKGTATSKTPIATSNDTTIPTTAWVNAKQATTKQKGLVQLINSYTSTSQTLAPTANALKMVYDMLGDLKDYIDNSFVNYGKKYEGVIFPIRANYTDTYTFKATCSGTLSCPTQPGNEHVSMSFSINGKQVWSTKSWSWTTLTIGTFTFIKGDVISFWRGGNWGDKAGVNGVLYGITEL